MCGITGIFAYNEKGRQKFAYTEKATEALRKRGPDDSGTYNTERISFGHRRLSVIDTSEKGKQPLHDNSGRFTIIFNGEIYNYRELRKELLNKGHEFHSGTDTEVLLKLYIEKGKSCLDDLNGFFAFAIYDKKEEKMFLARDRMGIKPLFYYSDEDSFIFGSELKALIQYNVPKKIDHTSLNLFLQLNYIPAPWSILDNVKKLRPGHYIELNNNEVNINAFYELSDKFSNNFDRNYDHASSKLKELMDDAVKKRMVSDVPLGSFLSGGVDSSVISAIASKYSDKKLKTFSIGYKDEPFFDETYYANLVANKIGSDHTVFKLTNNEFFDNLFEILAAQSEPFGDSSAIAVYILSKYTRFEVTVALSGDGADELFAGYNKHMAEYRARQKGALNKLIKNGKPLWDIMPGNRNSTIGNFFRKLKRYSAGLNYNEAERYWRWACISSYEEVEKLLKRKSDKNANNKRKKEYISNIHNKSFNEVLEADLKMVLPGDMLTKVDQMSMANSLEIRTPFLDHQLVEFACSLPTEFKLNNKMKKRLLQDTFRDILPQELYNRPKKGFEVPLLKWFKNELYTTLDQYLSFSYIDRQGIFDPNEVEKIRNQLYTKNAEDSQARIWSLLCFQYWWNKNIE
ncbi:MAG: asparagine synthase (glutamine-hydrolyzing) [Flavobacteriales bacterium]